jgi:DHA1 family L-arabinose/isopropyl-beta-D-thiogalactopyranoside export protein-like MFS transporter
MLARIVVACAHSVFWSIASPIAVQVVSKEHHTKALSMIITGTSIAMVIGMPLGRMIGLSIGWRMTFLCVGVIAFLTCAYLIGVFPKIESQESFSIKELKTFLKNPVLIGIYILNFLVATAYYTGYSYIEPFLKQIAGFANSSVTITLTIFGLSGLIGSYLFSTFYPHCHDMYCGCIIVIVSSNSFKI